MDCWPPRQLQGIANRRPVPDKAVAQTWKMTDQGNIDTNVPFSSSFLVFRLNCLHHDARSRFEGGELEVTGTGEVAGS